MPQGVEHALKLLQIIKSFLVTTSLMPQGVEHLTADPDAAAEIE